MILKSHTILYVDDQAKSTAYYAAVLHKNPHLNTPGMTEFELNDHTILGLMPKTGILRILGEALPGTSVPAGPLQAELYLVVEQPEDYLRRALAAGGRHLSELALRSWGHMVAYCLDLDGYVLAFAADPSTNW